MSDRPATSVRDILAVASSQAHDPIVRRWLARLLAERDDREPHPAARRRAGRKAVRA